MSGLAKVQLSKMIESFNEIKDRMEPKTSGKSRIVNIGQNRPPTAWGSLVRILLS